MLFFIPHYADIGGRRGIRNGATTSSFLDPEPGNCCGPSPPGVLGLLAGFGELVRKG